MFKVIIRHGIERENFLMRTEDICFDSYFRLEGLFYSTYLSRTYLSFYECLGNFSVLSFPCSIIQEKGNNQLGLGVHICGILMRKAGIFVGIDSVF